jgi:hypothetical protein
VKLQWIGRQADGAPEVPSNDSAPSEKVEVVLRLSE